MHERTVHTIGHSNHSLVALAGLLAQQGINAVADVRSAPYSRFNPQFNKDVLSRALGDHGISYAYLGRELGGRVDDAQCYEAGQIQYDRVARTRTFREGLERLCTGARKYRLAVMCAEKEPLDCHRTLLVAPALERGGFRVVHMHGDGRTETNMAAMTRLLELHKLNDRQGVLFGPERTREALVAEAISLQAKRVAYVDEAAAGRRV